MEQRIITPEIKEQLEKIATRLPNIPLETKNGKPVPQHRRRKGQWIIDKKWTDSAGYYKGFKIRPNKYYYLEEKPVMINHYANLEKIYLQKGFEGTAEYISTTKQKATE